MDNPIYRRYQAFVEDACSRLPSPAGWIIKTDTFNEAHTRYPILPFAGTIHRWFYIEKDEETNEIAAEKFPYLEIETGDIRYLSFADKSVNLVIDLSTIDHVWEYEQVLDEYYRVLINNGFLLIVVWTKEEFDVVKNKEDDYQFYFNRKEWEAELINRFTILETEELPNTIGGDGLLIRYLCRKEMLK